MLRHGSQAQVSRRVLLGAAVAVPSAALTLPSAEAAVDSAMVAARIKHFGAANVDGRTGAVNPSRVILSWVGVTTFAMAFRGKVVLLDAWVPRGLTSGYVPTTPTELAQLRPAAIFIGHAHFDHAGDAAAIAAATGAVVVGTPQQCAQIKSQANTWETVRTLPVGDESDRAGTRYDLTIAGIDMSVMAHVHSAAKAPDLDDPSTPLLLVPGLCSLVENPASAEDLVHLGSHAADQPGGALLYQFRGGATALTWHDSTGALPEDAPWLPDDLGRLPLSTIQIGALQGFDQYTNGLRDPRLYIEALRPRIFVPAHHDNWAPVITTQGSAYEEPLAQEIARLPPEARPEVRFLRDPLDYVNPARLTF